MARGLVLKNILKNPSEGCGVWSNFSPDVLRKSRRNPGKILESSGARPVNVRAFVEDHINVGKTEVGETAHRLDSWRASQGVKNGVVDLILDDVGSSVPMRQ